jgi:hypothetical protein
MAPPDANALIVELAVRVVLVTPEASREFAVMLPPILKPEPAMLFVVLTVIAPSLVVAPTVLPKVTIPDPAAMLSA